MIEINVHLENKFDETTEKVIITKEELYQMACNKAEQNYVQGHYDRIYADDEIKLKIEVQ